MFASTTRLDLGITVGPEKPGHIKTILSGSLPIFLDYRCHDRGLYDLNELEEITGSALWRMRAVLKHHPDRVREITLEGERPSFNKFFKMTNCAFPMLESLYLGFFFPKPNIPATFLGGPDLSHLHHLRRLTVNCIAFASIFDFLLSTTTLTDLTLVIDTPFGPTPETSLHTCLQAMPCLLSLNLTVLARPSPSAPEDIFILNSSPEDTVILCPPDKVVIHPKLKRFHFIGDDAVRKAFIRWLRAPSLEHCKIRLYPSIRPRLPIYDDRDIEEPF